MDGLQERIRSDVRDVDAARVEGSATIGEGDVQVGVNRPPAAMAQVASVSELHQAALVYCRHGWSAVPVGHRSRRTGRDRADGRWARKRSRRRRLPWCRPAPTRRA